MKEMILTVVLGLVMCGVGFSGDSGDAGLQPVAAPEAELGPKESWNDRIIPSSLPVFTSKATYAVDTDEGLGTMVLYQGEQKCIKIFDVLSPQGERIFYRTVQLNGSQANINFIRNSASVGTGDYDSFCESEEYTGKHYKPVASLELIPDLIRPGQKCQTYKNKVEMAFQLHKTYCDGILVDKRLEVQKPDGVKRQITRLTGFEENPQITEDLLKIPEDVPVKPVKVPGWMQ